MIKTLLIVGTIALMVSCSKVPVIEYRDVYIPTPVYLERPDRPSYSKLDDTISYLIKVLNYSRGLEFIIDTNNKGTYNGN